jgi:hypothetical protein
MARESDFTPLFTLPKFSFGLRQLFLWTAAIALGLVALRSASPFWVAAMMGLALLVLASSILLVVFRQGATRAYWIGFATFGWLYTLLLCTGWWPVDPTSDVNSPFRAHNFLTQQVSDAAYHWLYDKAFEKYYTAVSMSSGGMYGPGGGMGSASMGGYSGSFGPGMTPGGMSGGMPMMSGAMPASGMGMGGPAPPFGPPPGPNQSDFVRVAHALWTLLLATIGGCLAFWLYSTGPGRSERPAAG